MDTPPAVVAPGARGGVDGRRGRLGRRSRVLGPVALLVVLTAAGLAGAGSGALGAERVGYDSRSPAHDAAPLARPGLGALGWQWPVRPVLVDRPFVAPAHEYGPGHRGIDLRPTVDDGVRAPADGVVAFAGSVAGRGILTIDHGGGLVTTFEPVSTDLAAGAAVVRGAVVATLAIGGHAEPGAVHFGVRLDGAYINPMLLLGGVPRAVLLPCCG